MTAAITTDTRGGDVMPETISEEASEKRKRGRPQIMSEAADQMARFCAPEVKTARGRQEVFYRMMALASLEKDDRFLWLANIKKMAAGESGAWKPSILSELGRIGNEEEMRAIALRICELKPKTKEAIAMIRRFRLDREPESNPLTLFSHFAKAVDRYREMHPSVIVGDIVSGLRDMADFLEDEEALP